MSKNQDIHFYILIRSWNSFGYFDRCVDSVFMQRYKDYKILFIDDCSEYARWQRTHIAKRLRKHVVIFNKERKYSVYNAYWLLHQYAENLEAVVFDLDGDDWLPHANVLDKIVAIYRRHDCWFTYGSCLYWTGRRFSADSSQVAGRQGEKIANQPYPETVVSRGLYRREPLRALHPRTWKTWLYKRIRKSSFLRPDKSWIQFSQDHAIALPLLEMAGRHHVVIREPLYVYNAANPLLDVKLNYYGQLRDELTIRKKPSYAAIS